MLQPCTGLVRPDRSRHPARVDLAGDLAVRQVAVLLQFRRCGSGPAVINPTRKRLRDRAPLREAPARLSRQTNLRHSAARSLLNLTFAITTYLNACRKRHFCDCEDHTPERRMCSGGR